MAICQCHWGRFCTFTVQVSWEKELFDLLQLYFGDGLEITGHSAITLGETLHSNC